MTETRPVTHPPPPPRPPPPQGRRWPLRASDVQGLARLGVDGTLGVAHLVEAMHQAVLSGGGRLGRPPVDGQPVATGGLTGGVYSAVRGTTRAVGWGLDGLLGLLARRRGPAAEWAGGPPAEREALLAVLNGVLGDHLAATGNPLAISPGWRVGGLPWSAQGVAAGAGAVAPTVTGRVLVMVHGLCMNDLQFQRHGHDHAAVLQRASGCTPVYWHYNTGRHVADNGLALSQALTTLLQQWPVPVTGLVLLGHSMGGLVLRSACHQAAQTAVPTAEHTAPAVSEHAPAPWLAQTTHLFCLGTPHHGAPLERGGHLLDRALGLSPWVAPLARIGQVRSAGITDLRFGHVRPPASDQPGGRHADHHDRRPATPLPAGVFCGLVAATTGQQRRGLHSATVGDGLVPLDSALGRHRRPALALHVPLARQRVITQANHWDLLSRPEVAEQLVAWLG